jgi:O-acetyl-ADP-ribose deacetylase
VQLEVIEGDIAQLDVDAIANAANNELWMGAGVAGAIKRAGGRAIEADAMAQGPVKVGEAVVTGGGNLKAKNVIHGAVMGQDLRTNAEVVALTTKRVLQAADELGARSVALPAFGTGVGGFPLAECAEIMVREAGSYEPQSLERVIFAVFGDEGQVAFRRALETAQG